MHEVCQHRTALLGIDAVSLKSIRQFPRHSHDQFGLGVLHVGGHRSWSDIGWVEATRGDIIMVNPGEMHDGTCLDQKPRGWNMLYFEPQIASEILEDDQCTTVRTLRPAVSDRNQAKRFERLFNALTEPHSDNLQIGRRARDHFGLRVPKPY